MKVQDIITDFLMVEREHNLIMSYERLEKTLRHIANIAYNQGCTDTIAKALH